LIAGLLAGFAGAADLAKDQALKIASDAGDLKRSTPHRARQPPTAHRRLYVQRFVRYPTGQPGQLEPGHRRVLDRFADKKVWTFKLRRASSSIPTREVPTAMS